MKVNDFGKPLKEQFMNFIRNFDQQKLLNHKTPAWLKTLRQQAWQRFAQTGFPTVKEEEWKYTNIAPIAERQFELIFENGQPRDSEALKDYLNPDELNLTFINGIFSPGLSNVNDLPKGVEIRTLREVLNQGGPEVKQFFQNQEIDKESGFIALNKALSQEGAYIKIGDKTVVDRLIHVIYLTDTQKEIIYSPHTFIHLGHSSEAKICESHLSFNQESVYFVNSLTDVSLKENAALWYCKAQSESRKAFHIASTRVEEKRNSSFNGFALDLGSRIARNSLDISLNGEGGSATLNGLYCVDHEQHVDNHTCVDHRQPNATSNQLYKGILNGESRAVFNGKIIVRQAAQKTNSYQLNKNILLGKNCLVDTKPQLEIFADDVKCTHGATIGQLNEDEIFYLRTRAIPKKEAVKILSRGFVDDVLQKIPSQSIVEKLNFLLEPTFAHL